MTVEVKPALQTLKQLRVAGKIADLVRARKSHKCCVCPLPIKPGEEYYCIYTGGGGLGSLKFPDRIHIECLDDYINRGLSPPFLSKGYRLTKVDWDVILHQGVYPNAGIQGDDAVKSQMPGAEGAELGCKELSGTDSRPRHTSKKGD